MVVRNMAIRTTRPLEEPHECRRRSLQAKASGSNRENNVVRIHESSLQSIAHLPGQGWRVVISHYGFARMGHLALGCKCVLTSRWQRDTRDIRPTWRRVPCRLWWGLRALQRSVERRHSWTLADLPLLILLQRLPCTRVLNIRQVHIFADEL